MDSLKRKKQSKIFPFKPSLFASKKLEFHLLKVPIHPLLRFASCGFWRNWGVNRSQNPFLMMLPADTELSYLKQTKLSEIYLTFNTKVAYVY